jgi:hypothetical protein
VEGPASRLFNEWAGLQFLGEVGGDPPPAPRLYGGDRQADIFLMEDFGTGTRLDHALLGLDAAAAARTLVALSGTVAGGTQGHGASQTKEHHAPVSHRQ